MTLSRRAAGFLLAVAAWNALTWVTFLRNLAADPDRSTSFYVVHAAVAAISLLAATGVAVLGCRGWRASGRRTPLADARRAAPRLEAASDRPRG